MYAVIGLIGGFFLLLAYASISFKVLSSDDLLYHLFNILGAAGLVVSNYMLGAWPGAFVNLVFGFIGCVGIYNASFRKEI
jgi:hypothetical protein